MRDRLAAMAGKMLKLHRQPLTARTPHEQTGIRRQIVATNAEIDRQAHGLYGLTTLKSDSLRLAHNC